MKCSVCGHEMKAGAKFCNKCGNKIEYHEDNKNMNNSGIIKDSENSDIHEINPKDSLTALNTDKPDTDYNVGEHASNYVKTINNYHRYDDLYNESYVSEDAVNEYNHVSNGMDKPINNGAKNNRVYLAIIAILLVVLVAGGVYIFVEKSRINNQYSEEQSDVYDDYEMVDEADNYETEYEDEEISGDDEYNTDDGYDIDDVDETQYDSTVVDTIDGQPYGYVAGTVSKVDSEYVLSLDSPISVRGYDTGTDGTDEVIIDDVERVNVHRFSYSDPICEALYSVCNMDIPIEVGGYFQMINKKFLIVADSISDYDTGVDMLAEMDISNDYILPDSGTRLLKSKDVKGLSLRMLNYAKNEIYARHELKFDSKELQEYFDSKDWYEGTISSEDFSDDCLSSIELKNANFLREKEFEKNPKGYKLDSGKK